MHHPTDRITHTTAFVTPVVEHWLEREIDLNGSVDSSHRVKTGLNGAVDSSHRVKTGLNGAEDSSHS